MPIAKARVSNELSVQQLVEALVSEWTDDENDVLAHLARLLEADKRDRGHEGIAVYYKHPLGVENEDGSVKYHPLKIPVDKDVLVNVLFGITENDDWKIEDKRLSVYAEDYKLKGLQHTQRPYVRIDALPESINTKVSLRNIFVNKFDITSFLLGKNLPVPQGWRKAAAPGDGLGQSAQSKAASGTTPHRDDKTGKRIQSVLEKAAEIKARNQHLSIAGIANHLAKRDTIGKSERYGFESIRKILSGTFDPANRRGIRGLAA